MRLAKSIADLKANLMTSTLILLRLRLYIGSDIFLGFGLAVHSPLGRNSQALDIFNKVNRPKILGYTVEILGWSYRVHLLHLCPVIITTHQCFTDKRQRNVLHLLPYWFACETCLLFEVYSKLRSPWKTGNSYPTAVLRETPMNTYEHAEAILSSPNLQRRKQLFTYEFGTGLFQPQ